VGLVFLLHRAGGDNSVQKTTSGEAKLGGHIVSPERGWVVAQEEPKVCDD